MESRQTLTLELTRLRNRACHRNILYITCRQSLKKYRFSSRSDCQGIAFWVLVFILVTCVEVSVDTCCSVPYVFSQQSIVYCIRHSRASSVRFLTPGNSRRARPLYLLAVHLTQCLQLLLPFFYD